MVGNCRIASVDKNEQTIQNTIHGEEEFKGSQDTFGHLKSARGIRMPSLVLSTIIVGRSRLDSFVSFGQIIVWTISFA